MTDALYASIGQALISIGLYTVAFESMVLSFRSAVASRLAAEAPDSDPEFRNACKTAASTFEYCGPWLVEWGVLEPGEIEALSTMRDRRNFFAHEGYNCAMTLTVAEISDDIQHMFAITRKTDRYKQVGLGRDSEEMESGPPKAKPFTIAPAILGMYLMAAESLATKLGVVPNGDPQPTERSDGAQRGH